MLFTVKSTPLWYIVPMEDDTVIDDVLLLKSEI